MRKRRESDEGGFQPFETKTRGLHRNTRIKDQGDYNGTGIQECESGPSRITINDLERMERYEDGLDCIVGYRTTLLDEIPDELYSAEIPSTSLPISTSTQPTPRATRRPVSRRRIAIAAALTISFLPLTSAAPPYRAYPNRISATPSQPTPTPTSTLTRIRNYPRQQSSIASDSSITTSSATTSSTSTSPESRLDEEEINYDINYLTSMSTPTHALPTDVYMVAETRLPFYLSQDQDGSWTKVDDAWFLYGRQAGVATAVFGPDEDPIATAVPTSLENGTAGFAITDALPPGWGIEATRSEFYRTPLIVAMSVILALMIVAGIIFIVIKRRKQHRRAKRRAARMRRKALVAAGLTEDDINNNGDGVDSALREKLAQIEGIAGPKPKPRSQTKKERGPTTLIRTKVRSWNQDVLRRRKQVAGVGLGPSRSATPSIHVIDEEEDKPDHDPNIRIDRGSNDTDRTTPTVASTSTHDRREFGSGSGSAEVTTSDSTTPSSSDLPRAATQPPTATYFPPAYRPASVRSLQVGPSVPSGPSGSNSSPGHRNGDTLTMAEGETRSRGQSRAVEKTTAPGYYPAPATEDSEVALAVASRSDGKQRMDVAPPDEEEEERDRIRHIATDDKGVLERMRLGGSAPQQSATPSAPGVGPSAPIVEVDEEGFESHDPLVLGSPLPEHQHEHDQDEDQTTPTTSSSGIPAPPRRRPMAYRLYSQDDLAASLDIHEHHLVPSAPPPAHEDHLVPSAPAIPDDLEGDEDRPSAPTFEIGEDEPELELEQSNSDPSPSPSLALEATGDTISEPEDSRHQGSGSGEPAPESSMTTLGLEEQTVDHDHARKPSLPTYEP